MSREKQWKKGEKKNSSFLAYTYVPKTIFFSLFSFFMNLSLKKKLVWRWIFPNTCSLDLFPWKGSTTASTFFTSGASSGFIIAAAAASSSSCSFYYYCHLFPIFLIWQIDTFYLPFFSTIFWGQMNTFLLLQELRLHPLHLLHLPLPRLLVCSHLDNVFEMYFLSSFFTLFYHVMFFIAFNWAILPGQCIPRWQTSPSSTSSPTASDAPSGCSASPSPRLRIQNAYF